MKVFIFGHKNPDTDTICSAIAYADLKSKIDKTKNYTAAKLGEINKETKFVIDYFNIEEPILLESVDNQNVILVDHNERKQSADSINNSNIIEIIDHHRIADIETKVPIYITIEPLGSTASIIYKKYLQNNLKIPKDIAGLLLSAVLSDTLILTSPTTTSEDIKIVHELVKLCDITDFNEYGTQMLKAGSSFKGYTTKQIFNTDVKKFEFKNVICFISQVFTFDVDYILNQKNEILKTMENHISENNASLAIFVVTDLKTNNSTMLATGEAIWLAQKTFNMEKNEIFLPNIVSRKSQIVPPLTEIAHSV
ncbi:MAG: manganese-dependent inorganic pyrophosphatase [Defluviitaleaceae bacterium]|nr:manganese-dependent inorganic pyrophosphatase [Defluviitaleaceae bacterium]